MQELAAVKLNVQNSRFFAHLYKIDKADDLKIIIKSHKKIYRKAKHHCYALNHYSISNSQIIELFKDDGEIGHPGKVLLEILKKHNLTNNVIVVSRIFGGKKLGVGGVSRAFKDVGEFVIEHFEKS